jgi:iron complex outermembrane recepter protein
MSIRNARFQGVALAALTAAMILPAAPAFAQSTGSQQAEEEVVVVTGVRNRSTGGMLEAENAPKTRSNINAEYIASQIAGQSVIQNLNLLPGVNFVNNDPYGGSGGNLRLRGFDGNRISLTLDGIQLNDSGNYAIFTNQQIDGEYITRTTVNTGTTDVDSPSASATGGTINILTRRPDAESSWRLNASLGQWDHWRGLVSYDTGEIGPWGTTGFVGVSQQSYSKFRGAGDLERRQFNAQLFQPLNGQDFVRVMFHYNQNRNNQYRSLTEQQIAFYGRRYDQLDRCTRVAPVAGVAQNENATVVSTTTPVFLAATDNLENPSSCTNYYGIRINPSDTGNIRGQSSFQVLESVKFTFDWAYQYVLANGGGTNQISETDRRLRGVNPTAGTLVAGVDLNGDGDFLDTIRFYTPNNTNTHRYSANASLIWELNPSNRFRVAYTFDRARHRQTGEWGTMDSAGGPEDVFGGRTGVRVRTADGSFIRGRDRLSYATLNQVSFDYTGRFFDDNLTLRLGVRAPVFERELNQFCLSQNGTSNVLCTTETPTATLANGNLTFASQGTNQYIAPYQATKEYDAVLPNIGISYRLGDSNLLYASYAESLSAPRTDNLYTPLRSVTDNSIQLNNAEPETTESVDVGYRYQGQRLVAALALWQIKYQNRIVSAFDETLGISVDRNVGDVEMQGIDFEAGFRVTPQLTVNATASFNDSELLRNVPLSATTLLPTAGKALVETPDTTYGLRVNYNTADGFRIGVQGKFVGDRFATDVNDAVAQSYTIVDMNMSYDLGQIGWDNTTVQFNATNLFNTFYLGNINTTNNAQTIANVSTVTGTTVARSGLAPTYSIGAPQTFQLTLRTKF